MKDMHYPIDIVWIDNTFHIIGISRAIDPSTYPTVFYPPASVRYVLEVNAGFSTGHAISENQLLTIEDNPSF